MSAGVALVLFYPRQSSLPLHNLRLLFFFLNYEDKKIRRYEIHRYA
jgi:hypothetical protein